LQFNIPKLIQTAGKVRLKFKPLLRYLSDVAHKRKMSVYCYEDLESHVSVQGCM